MPKIDPDAAEKIDAAIAAAPDFAKPVMQQLREVILGASPDLVEDWKWRTSCVASPSGLICGYAAFKAHVSLHFFKGNLIDSPETKLFDPSSCDTTSRHIKFTDASQIKPAALKRLVKAAIKTEASGAKHPKKTKRDLTVPDELTAELKKKKNTKAHKFFDSLPYSAQKEFVVWITGAKREETKTRRLAQTIEMLSRGERKNEKYRNC